MTVNLVHAIYVELDGTTLGILSRSEGEFINTRLRSSWALLATTTMVHMLCKGLTRPVHSSTGTLGPLLVALLSTVEQGAV